MQRKKRNEQRLVRARWRIVYVKKTCPVSVPGPKNGSGSLKKPAAAASPSAKTIAKRPAAKAPPKKRPSAAVSFAKAKIAKRPQQRLMQSSLAVKMPTRKGEAAKASLMQTKKLKRKMVISEKVASQKP